MKVENKKLLSRYRRLVLETRMFALVGIILLACFLSILTLEAYQTELPEFFYSVLRSIFLAILSSVIIVSAINLYTSRKNVDVLKQEIGDLFSEKLGSANFHLHGIVNVHDGMPHTRLKEEILNNDTMFILQTWIADLTVIKETLRKFCEGGGRLQIAILHPEAEFVQLRCNEINSSYEIFSRGIISNISEIREVAGGSVDIRLHHQTPSISIYGFPDTVFVGNYLNRLHAVQGPQLEVREGYYSEKVREHFLEVWGKSDIVSDQYYDDLCQKFENNG